MRRLKAPLPYGRGPEGILVLLLLLLSGCGRAPVVVVEKQEPVAAAVDMSDPAAARQLISGFHELEYGAWRWTAGRFSAMLQPPADAPLNGAVLELRLAIPEAIAKRGPVTLRGSIEGTALAPETYVQPGEYVYAREAPAEAFPYSPAVAQFTLDRFIPAGEAEPRELGIIVRKLALRPRAGTSQTPAGPAGRPPS